MVKRKRESLVLGKYIQVHNSHVFNSHTNQHASRSKQVQRIRVERTTGLEALPKSDSGSRGHRECAGRLLRRGIEVLLGGVRTARSATSRAGIY